MALAIVDTIILAYVAASVPWGLETPSVGSSPLGDLIKWVAIAVTLAAKVFTAGLMFAVGYAIVRDLRGPWKPSWVSGLLLVLPFLAGLTLLGYLAVIELRDAFFRPAFQLADRLVIFDRLAEAHGPGQSLGAYLAVLVLGAYLIEKYMLRWFNVRHHVVGLVGLAFIAYPVYLAWNGERAQREALAAQQWHAVAEKKTWLESLDACKVLGPGWRLPRKLELTLYAASAPEAIRGWKGVAWTSIASELGRTVVTVELEPRRKGVWRSNYVPWRDRSLCETDAYQSRRNSANDWFTALLPHFCEGPADYEGLHVSTVQLTTHITGSVVGGPETKLITVQTEAAAICTKAPATELPDLRHRRYPKEKEFRDSESFLAFMRESCNPRALGSDAGACATFGGDAPTPVAK